VAKRNTHSFKKYQKELKRKEKAKEKLDRRQRKKNHDIGQADQQPQYEKSTE
jgi:hypothetical protein